MDASALTVALAAAVGLLLAVVLWRPLPRRRLAERHGSALRLGALMIAVGVAAVRPATR